MSGKGAIDSCRQKRAFYQWMLQVISFLFVAPGGAVSQFPNTLCTSPLMIGGRIFIENIPENIPVGATLGNLHLVGSASEIALHYLEPHPSIAFNTTSQNLTVIEPLSKDAYDYIDIKVECEMLARGFKLPILIKIMILDVNNHRPEFIDAPYFTSISELMPIGTTIISGIQATDADIDNWKITFEVQQNSPYASHFAFPIETSGSLVLTKPLNFEEVHMIELYVVAKDHHPPVLNQIQPQLNSTALARIEIYDGDDQNPQFTSPSYLAYVTENSLVGTSIQVQPNLMAYDQDFGLNATLNYSFVQDTIHNPPQSDYFDIENVTGLVTLRNDVLRRGEQFSLTIKATQVDNINRYSMSLLFILVQAANENIPKFLQKEYKANLVENVPAGSYVTTVSAIDNDVVQGTSLSLSLPPTKGSILTYGFTNPLLVHDFTIDSSIGVIVTSQALNYERQPRYNISVSVTDGRFFDYTYLVVELMNVNNHNPVFGRGVYQFQGHKEPDFFIGRLQATDLDVGSIITYKLAENNSLFKLTPGSGEITLVGDVDTIKDDDEFLLYVLAEDEGIPPRRDVALVRVTFGSGLGAVVADTQTNLVVIIIVGVLAGCLLLIIIVLSIYIYRNSSHVHPSLSSPYASDAEHIDAYFESSKSFDRGINEIDNLPTHGYKDVYVDPSEGMFKPTTRDRHLAMYHDVNVHNGTSVQENPFQDMEPPSRYRYQEPRGSMDHISEAGYSAQSLEQSNPTSSSRSMPRDSGMHAVNEIDYDTSLAPITMVDPTALKDSYDSTSEPSFLGSGNSLSTFKAGNSTQALVPHHSPNNSSVGYRGGKGSSVSFIDDHQVNVYHPDNAINPRPGRSTDKPEITVYY